MFGGSATCSASPLLGDSATSTSSSILSSSPSSSLVPLPQPYLASPTSISTKLAQAQFSGAVISNLISSFLESSQKTHVTLITGTPFAEKFEKAGRRLNALDDQSQVLFHVIIALGARLDPSPLFCGPNAPSSKALSTRDQIGVDLRTFGKNREKACVELKEMALDMIDRMGTMRCTSLESVTALMLVEGLMEQDDNSEDEARPFVSAYSTQARQLMEDTTQPEIRSKVAGTVLGWTAYLRDSMLSATRGRASTYSDDDILLLRQGKPEPPSLELALKLRYPNPEESFWFFLNSYMTTLANAARSVSKKVTGISARRSLRLDETFAEDFLQTYENLRLAHDAANSRLKTYYEWLTFTYSPRLGSHMDLPAVLRGLTIYRCTLIAVVQKEIKRRIDSKGETMIRSGKATLDGFDDDYKLYWMRMELLEKRVKSACFEAARDIVGIIRETLETGGPLGGCAWQDARGTNLLFKSVPEWTQYLLDMPVTEESGETIDWTYASKVDALTWILNGLYSVGWAYERLGRPATWVFEELEKTQSKQSAFYTQLAADLSITMSVALSPATSGSTLFSSPSSNSSATLAADFALSPSTVPMATDVQSSLVGDFDLTKFPTADLGIFSPAANMEGLV